MTYEQGGRYRVGSHYGIHVYEDDRPVATFHTTADAKAFVQAANGLAAAEARAETLARQVAAAKAEGWDEAVQALAWCRDHGSADTALTYVAERNPYRAALDTATEEATHE